MADIPEDVRKLAANLQAAYNKVAEWPEKRMSKDAVIELGEGFTDLLALRNLVPGAIAAIMADREKRGEPVAYAEKDGDEWVVYWPDTGGTFEHIRDYPALHKDITTLYTAPPAPAQPVDVDAVIERCATWHDRESKYYSGSGQKDGVLFSVVAAWHLQCAAAIRALKGGA